MIQLIQTENTFFALSTQPAILVQTELKSQKNLDQTKKKGKSLKGN